VAERRDAIFRGEHIHVSEDRAVLHFALCSGSIEGAGVKSTTARKLTVGVIGALICGCLSPAVASAANRYAEPAGDGAEPCVLTEPCDLDLDGRRHQAAARVTKVD
jgi:glucose-6-phosphate isomerase